MTQHGERFNLERLKPGEARPQFSASIVDLTRQHSVRATDRNVDAANIRCLSSNPA
jgi:hypothetical protein